MIESIFFLSSGLFYSRESIAINVYYFLVMLISQILMNRTKQSIYEMFELLCFLIFNISETISHYRFEHESFISIMYTNKMSIQYIKFVNRLLPKHVASI